jgi:hypothetical protein
MITRHLNLELQAWAVAGMQDTIGDPLLSTPPGREKRTAGSIEKRNRRRREKKGGIQLSLFTT